MRVDRNQAVGGVPLRLQIAAQLFGPLWNIVCQSNLTLTVEELVPQSFLLADALIAAHNATCEETPQ